MAKRRTDREEPTEEGRETDRLLRAWKREIRRRAFGSNASWILMALLALITLAGLGMACFALQDLKAFFPAVILALEMSLLMAGAIAQGFGEPQTADGLTPAQKEILAALLAPEAPPSVGFLLTLIERAPTNSLMARAAWEVLPRLLPRLDAEAARALPEAQRRVLYRVFTGNSRGPLLSELGSAVLPILIHLGDPEALARVALLILREAPTPQGQSFRAEAERLFPELLAATDFGGVTALPDWIQRLPIGPHGGMSWHRYVLPQLALRQLLPQLTPEQFLALLPTTRQRLYRSLHSVHEYQIDGDSARLFRLGPDYRLPVIDLARRARDREAIPTIRALAHNEVPASRSVRAAAQTALPDFEALAREKQTERTLLRASGAPETSQEVLLRPAAGSATTDPQELLRANLHGTLHTVTQETHESLHVGSDPGN